MKGRIHLFHNTIRNSFSYTTDIIKWKGNFSIWTEYQQFRDRKNNFYLFSSLLCWRWIPCYFFCITFFFNLVLFFITIAHAFKWKPLSNVVTIKLIFPKWILKHFRFYELKVVVQVHYGARKLNSVGICAKYMIFIIYCLCDFEIKIKPQNWHSLHLK